MGSAVVFFCWLQLCVWTFWQCWRWLAMLGKISPLNVPATGPQKTPPSISTCTSAKETAPEKRPSFSLPGRQLPACRWGDTVCRPSEEMEPSRWTLWSWRRPTQADITVEWAKLSLCCTRRSVYVSKMTVGPLSVQVKHGLDANARPCETVHTHQRDEREKHFTESKSFSPQANLALE